MKPCFVGARSSIPAGSPSPSMLCTRHHNRVVCTSTTMLPPTGRLPRPPASLQQLLHLLHRLIILSVGLGLGIPAHASKRKCETYEIRRLVQKGAPALFCPAPQKPRLCCTSLWRGTLLKPKAGCLGARCAYRATLRAAAIVPLDPSPRVGQLPRQVGDVLTRRAQRNRKVAAVVIVPAGTGPGACSQRIAVCAPCMCWEAVALHAAGLPAVRIAAPPSSFAAAKLSNALQGQLGCRLLLPLLLTARPHQVLVASSLSTKLRTSLASSPGSRMTTALREPSRGLCTRSMVKAHAYAWAQHGRSPQGGWSGPPCAHHQRAGLASGSVWQPTAAPSSRAPHLNGVCSALSLYCRVPSGRQSSAGSRQPPL
jgi:hypothetical protein